MVSFNGKFNDDLLPKTPRYLKVPLIFFNLVLWVLGLVLLIIGAVAVSFFSNLKDFKEAADTKTALNHLTTSVPVGVMVIGVFFILFTLFGCFAAYKERLVTLVIYCFLMLILLVILIGMGGKSITLHNNDVVAVLGDSWQDVSNNQKKNSTITKLETFLECCQWNSTVSVDTPQFKDLCPKDDDGNAKYIDNYCETELQKQLSSNLYIVGVTSIVIGVIEFFCMLFSLFLIIRICKSPRSKYNSDY
ncbi:hypothetical protein DICPUDRAFT_39101 [Dictyostelium purpureum]|uniref:Tetraspanin n=1 Tax=Dictyostelium purpureum TaxID=5786 RepID=F0ZVR5_DICPU|nr:uncharacterized protein DICPUDRAFT_39101 [Dictyostelium purpureum]EGC31974.1 hypothetical protein DICPUDRAFT_39101 [Dictyostelium purpureum]|eukprot:XP_003291510.1 hypothetical protein DICPUDRAFT_39101 [Dictyostelium purpureum]